MPPAPTIEYDDTRSRANHIQSVWRDHRRFRPALLADHHQANHPLVCR